ncbi:MAG: hypothetical protein KatS3mg031_2957 [Chitinophagales bacterium]|nr:MAG: hypothetical protein KatS3mg031_2957 [Chitinophagales bacterium]
MTVDEYNTHLYVYPGGYRILKQEAIDAVSYSTTTWNCDEKCVEKCREYNDEDVKEYIRENMYEFMIKNSDKLVFELAD